MAKKIEDIEEVKQYEVLPIRNTVLFPGVLMPVAVSRKSSLKLVKAAHRAKNQIVVLTQRDSSRTIRPLFARNACAGSADCAGSRTRIRRTCHGHFGRRQTYSSY